MTPGAQVKRFLAWALYAPPDAPCSASRTSTTAYGLMLIALLLCSCMAVFQLRWERRRCGPLAAGQSMVQAFRDVLQSRPAYVGARETTQTHQQPRHCRLLQSLVNWLLDPFVLVGLTTLLGACALLGWARAARLVGAHRRLAAELQRYRGEMQAKVVVTRRQTQGLRVSTTGNGRDS